MPILRHAAVLVAACAVVATALAEDFELSVAKARTVLRPARQGRAPRHRVHLKADFPLAAWADTFDPYTERVALTIGGGDVLVLEADGERDGLRAKHRYKWIYRSPRRAGAARVRMVLDVLFGRLNVRGRRLDLSALADHGPEDVQVRLELGDQAFTAEVDFDARGARWRLRPDPVAPPPPPPPPPPIDPPPAPGPLDRTIIDVGQTSGMTTQQTIVVRTQSTWAALWGQHKQDGSSAPPVDFARDMVVAVFLGDRPTSAYTASIDSVVAEASGGVSVIWTEGVTQGSCVIAPVVTQPYAIVRVRRVDGATSWISRSAIAICHGGP